MNSLCFRSKEPRKTRRRERLLLLGDSQLEGYHVRPMDTFGPKLQKALQH